MGRPRKKGPTVKVRMYKETKEELQVRFPKQDMSDLIDIAFRTSPLRIESYLRRNDKKSKKK